MAIAFDEATNKVTDGVKHAVHSGVEGVKSQVPSTRRGRWGLLGKIFGFGAGGALATDVAIQGAKGVQDLASTATQAQGAVDQAQAAVNADFKDMDDFGVNRAKLGGLHRDQATLAAAKQHLQDIHNQTTGLGAIGTGAVKGVEGVIQQAEDIANQAWKATESGLGGVGSTLNNIGDAAQHNPLAAALITAFTTVAAFLGIRAAHNKGHSK